MATLTISFNGLSRSWEVSTAHQTRVLNALKDNYADGGSLTNSEAFDLVTDGFINGLIDVTDTYEKRVAADAATSAITPVVFTEN